MKTLRYSINRNIHPNISFENSKNMYTDGWESTEIIWDEPSILEAVKSFGIITPILSNGKADINSVMSVPSIMLNFNEKESLENIKATLSQWDYSYLVFTSKNYNLRAWIPFKEDISKLEFSKVYDFFKEQFPNLETSTKTQTRYYYPAPAEITYFHDKDNFIDAKFLVKSRTDNTNNSIVTTKYLPKSNKNFSAEDYVIISTGEEIPIKEVKENGLRIVCRYCDGIKKNPDKSNAVLNITANGTYKQYCYEELKTRFQDPKESMDYQNLNLFFATDAKAPCQIHQNDEGVSIEYITTSNGNWENYCTKNNLDIKVNRYLDRLGVTFDPSLPFGKNENIGKFNYYKRLNVIDEALKNKLPESEVTLDYLKQNTPIIYNILFNLLGDDDYIDRFLHWISSILDGRKSSIVWLISSIQGAGKNFFYEHVLSKIFGKKHVITVNSTEIDDRFNQYDQQVLLKVVNELILTDNVTANVARTQFIKNDVGTDTRKIEGKGIDAFYIPNFMHYLLFTNKTLKTIVIEPNDRIFSVIRNENGKPLREYDWYGSDESIRNRVKNEVDKFIKYIVSIKIDTNKSNVALQTELKRSIQEFTKDKVINFLDLVINGDWSELYTNRLEISEDGFIDDCVTLNGISSKYFQTVFEEYFGNRIKKHETKKELKLNGLYSTIAKYPNGNSQGVWRIKNKTEKE